MYNLKNRIFKSMTKTQKSALCNFLRAQIKKCSNTSVEQVFTNFIDDETEANRG